MTSARSLDFDAGTRVAVSRPMLYNLAHISKKLNEQSDTFFRRTQLNKLEV